MQTARSRSFNDRVTCSCPSRSSPKRGAETTCFDEAVYMGYLLSSSVLDGNSEVEPIFPLMTILSVCEKSILGTEDDVFALWELIQRVLRFDTDRSGNELVVVHLRHSFE